MHLTSSSIRSQILQQLNLPASAVKLSDEFLAAAARPHLLVRAGHVIGTPFVLFAKRSPEEEAALRLRFAGSQADRAAAKGPTPPVKVPEEVISITIQTFCIL